MAAMHDSKLFAADVPPGGIGSQDQGGAMDGVNGMTNCFILYNRDSVWH